MTRIRAGVFASTDGLSAASFDERRLAGIRAVVGTRRGEVVLSHSSAAMVWALPSIHHDPMVHLIEPVGSARRSKNGVVIHRMPLSGDDIVVRDGMMVTSLVRTLFDLAREAKFVDALAALDRAIDRRDPLVPIDELTEYFEAHPCRGSVRALRILSYARELSETPLESFGRGTMLELGFPEPILQLEVRVASGRIRRLDYWWERYRIGAEADGRVKYAENPTGAIWEEKRREAELADVRVGFARFGWEDCVTPSRLATRLIAVGLPRNPTAIRF